MAVGDIRFFILFLFLPFCIVFEQCRDSIDTDWNNRLDNSSETSPTVSNDEIYKCVSYTSAHIDKSHLITEDFSESKVCRQSGLYTLNREDRQFKVDIDIQRSWIVDVSSIIFNGTIRPICGLNSNAFAVRPTESCSKNGQELMKSVSRKRKVLLSKNGVIVNITETDRFEVVFVYYDLGNLTIIITHHKQGEPLHFNINVWQTGANIDNSYGLCSGLTCSSEAEKHFAREKPRSTYSLEIISLICDIYIDNYLNRSDDQPFQRSLHYNRTIENVYRACLEDVQTEDWPYAAAGSVEVLFVEDQVNSDNITNMNDIQINFHTNLENELIKLAETIDRSKQQVEQMLSQLVTTTIVEISNTTATFSITKPPSSSNNLALIIGCSVAGGVVLIGLIAGVILFIIKKRPTRVENIKTSSNLMQMGTIERS